MSGATPPRSSESLLDRFVSLRRLVELAEGERQDQHSVSDPALGVNVANNPVIEPGQVGGLG